MLGNWLLPKSWTGQEQTSQRPPGPIGRNVNSTFVSLSRRACVHPIYTIVSVAILASTTYIGLLESSLFDGRITANHAVGRIELNNILAGSKKLYVGPDSNWKWSAEEARIADGAKDHFSLVTLLFPDSAAGSSRQPQTVNIPSNSSARSLPSSTNRLSTISYDYTLAFSMPFAETQGFLTSLQELPVTKAASERRYLEESGLSEEKMWIMRALKSPRSTSVGQWVGETWSEFVDLLKNADALDILIMFLGYLAMHLTFISLFVSMRRLGSNFWLGFTVLISGSFALLFGLIVTTKLGVPLNMVLLSEGLPFLVVTVGFEKPILLTKAVLAASLKRTPANQRGHDSSAALPSIQDAVHIAVKEYGWIIVRDYAFEITILMAGAFSGIQGGLRQFCFLATWILFFDCILLFTFYTAILTVKLEINRIKRHVALRRALEDDGISRRVAENVATNNDWPRVDGEDGHVPPSDNAVFGRKVGDRTIPKFKLVMVGGFVGLNVLNLLAYPFRGYNPPELSSLSKIVTQPPMDPFAVAGNGLDTLMSWAQSRGRSAIVTVLAPIKYELEYPSIHYAPSQLPNESRDGNPLYDAVGGKVVGGILKSFEDPVLSKWIVAALVMSLALNGYLFNAARWTIKEPVKHHEPAEEREVFDQPNQPRIPGAPAVDERLPPVRREAERPQALPPAPAEEGIVGEATKRTREEAEALIRDKRAHELTDDELVDVALFGKGLPGYYLEKALKDMTRAVKVRRAIVSRTHATRDTSTFLEHSNLPYEHYDYERVHGACCENVIGYMPLPVGLAGPLNVDGQNYFLPMATTEGVLVAGASRGCKAINAGGGAVTILTGDGMTRGPCVTFSNLTRAGAAKLWLDSEEGQKVMKEAFNSTSRFARLQSMRTAMAGTNLYIRFKTTTGDAMGMNMISKGVEHALHVMSTEAGFDDMFIVSVSGNFCTDKKAAAINWIDGRGKSVVAEAIIPGDVVRRVLKSDVDALVELNISKNLMGSAMAGSIGGFNAHAANIVAAIFIATGQDPAQVVEGSNCMTVMKNVNGNLQISVSMPSIEVGTIGGGTILEPQSSMLDLLGVRGAHPTSPGDNARQLARIVAAGVLAGELSLCAALAAGHLVQAHMAHNRSTVTSRAATPAPPTPTAERGMLTPTSLAMTSMSKRPGR